MKAHARAGTASRRAHRQPAATVTHRIAERMRLRINERRGDAAYFARLAESLAAHPLVDDVRVNPSTASILVLHHAESEGAADEILRYARAKGLFRLEKARAREGRPWPEAIFEKLEQADERIRSSTHGSWDLSAVTATGMLGLGLLQAFRRQWLPPAWTLVGDALVILSRTRHEQVGKREPVARRLSIRNA